ncbi:MAG: 3'-5' exonuclease, partial [Candidatus Kapaibacterium sp.]
YNALDQEDAVQRIAGRFRYIMVDEFQDTNELQYRIVRRMARQLQDMELICVVGDRKQSIYGFRGAEVEVFTEATGEIRKVNRDKGRAEYLLEYREELIEPESRDESLGEIRLDASFRLLPNICAYVNEACAPVMRSSASSDYGVEYEPLVCARYSEGKGKVEVLLVPPESSEEEDEVESEQLSEAELIARRILLMVTEREECVWEVPEGGEVEEARAARFSDIAILCRKRKTFEDIERALRSHGIPFLTHGSSGYFRTQEVYDMTNYLRTLLNSRDDIALLGLLRSPFFAISDAELYRISRESIGKDEGRDLWSRTVGWVQSQKGSEPIKRAVQLLEDDRAMASRIPVSLLMKRIVERTGWRGAVVGAERGEQMLANVDKLIDMARDFESRGFTNLFDFVEQLTAQIESEEMESEAAINQSRDAVRLMTMHGAKGLEFPVVFLPNLNSPTRVSNPPFFDKELGFGWNWTYNADEFRPMVTALMKMRRREKERAEEARIFYVALTRARDMLVISGECGDEPAANTMLEWSLAPLPSLPEEGEVSVQTQTLRFLEEDGATITSRQWSQNIHVRRSLIELEQYRPEGEGEAGFHPEYLQIGEIPARARGEIYSATQFLTYSQCPTKYYLRYRLGIPEEIAAAWEENPDESDSEDGTIFARLFREVARRITDSTRSRASTDSESADATDGAEEVYSTVEDIVERLLSLEPMDEATLTRLREQLITTVSNLLSSEEGRKRIFPEGSTSEGAKELRMPLGTRPNREFIVGVMDRLVTAEDGTLSFTQFKTLRLRDRDPETIAESYLPQIRLYAWLISKLNPKQRSITGTILFTEALNRPEDFTFSRFDLARTEEEIVATIEDIRALSYSGRRQLPLTTAHCSLCPYWIEGECLLGKE